MEEEFVKSPSLNYIDRLLDIARTIAQSTLPLSDTHEKFS